jgi:TonB family protein
MSNPEVWKTWEGRVVGGKFPLRQWLGGSDHSAVFLTDKQGQTDQKAAIKLIAADPVEAERQRLRWRATAQLTHPHLIPIYEIGRCQLDDTQLLYLVMEYAEEDLSQILPQRALAPAEVTDLLPPLLDALSYLHGKGFVHTRIKPSNILAVGDLLKLSSDQVASPFEGGTGRRRDVYDAPETAAGIVSPEGDLWSVGATLVEALTQKPPFAEETLTRDRGVLATVAEPFRGIARECLHLDPKRRCSIADIKARMQPAARSVPDPSPAPVLVKPARRYRAPWRVLVPIAVVFLFVLGIFLFHRIFPTKPPSDGQVKIETAPVASEAASSQPAPSAPAPAPKEAAKSRGEVVHQVIPDVPQSAKNTITGTIKVGVRVEVDSSGKITSAKLAPAGPSQYFANLALRAAEQWQFSPAQVNGQPASSAWLLKFRFKRTSTQVVPERASH